MKYLLFEGRHARRASRTKNSLQKGRNKPENEELLILKPNEATQRDVLCGAISEILWKSGGGEGAVLAIPGQEAVFEPNAKFYIDGLTEKLHLFKCLKEEELKSAVKKHIYFF